MRGHRGSCVGQCWPYSLRVLDTVLRAKVTLGKPAGWFLKDFIHPRPRLQYSTKLPVILDMPGSKVRKHFETTKNVGSEPWLPSSIQRLRDPRPLQNKGVSSCPRSRAAGRFCHLVNESSKDHRCWTAFLSTLLLLMHWILPTASLYTVQFRTPGRPRFSKAT